MFGFVAASPEELTQEEKERYGAVYCGICRQLRSRSSNLARLTLSYDTTFLALLLMSLYEPEEARGSSACVLHPIRQKPWVDNPCIRYAADMNVVLAYYNALDDWKDDGSHAARALSNIFAKDLPRLREAYPRQCRAIAECLDALSRLEEENCSNPDECAGCFGRLMAELLVWREDLWSGTLRRMGDALGRFIYLADAAVDYRRDLRKKKYNPYIAMGTGEDWKRWEQYLVLTLGRCTDHFERLPLVQDKHILDNILYSGVWMEWNRQRKEGRKPREEEHDG